MRFAVNLPNFGAFADTAVVAELAAAAEEAGWDGCFVWDNLRPDGVAMADPWVHLTAIALATQHIRFGAMVTPLPRRRPEEVALQAVTLDRLSGGRLILGAGLGDDSLRELSAFDGQLDDRMRAAMLDESLQVISGLWRGEPFSFEGEHFKVRDAVFQPPPLQQPRIPIWLAGRWPARAPFRRAAHWDGAVPLNRDGPMNPTVCREVAAFIQEQRGSTDAPFDIAPLAWFDPVSDAGRTFSAEMEAAGATWLQVSLPEDMDVAQAMAFVRRGSGSR